VSFPWKSACALAFVLGVGALALRSGSFSSRPEACTSCHLMQPQLDSWRASAHGKGMTCNDCHVAHQGRLRPFFGKLNDGVRHAAIFTLWVKPRSIRLRERGAHTVQANCLRCHGRPGEAGWKTDPALPAPPTPNTSAHLDASRACFECHRETPHGAITPKESPWKSN